MPSTTGPSSMPGVIDSDASAPSPTGDARSDFLRRGFLISRSWRIAKQSATHRDCARYKKRAVRPPGSGRGNRCAGDQDGSGTEELWNSEVRSQKDGPAAILPVLTSDF